MLRSSRPFRAPALLVLFTIAAGGTAHAGITGFGNFSGFSINQNDAGSPPTVPTPGTIELTNAGNEIRSIISTTPQPISQFTDSFTYQATHVGAFGTNPGAAFVLENDPRGATAVSNSPDVDGFQGITKSVAVTFDLGSNTSGLFTNGNFGSGAGNVSPVILSSGDPINVQLAYAGSTLTETLVDTTTSATFSTTFLVLTSIPTTVGGTTAFVGVTAGSSDIGAADEFFSNFNFTSGTSTPEPASLSLLSLAAFPFLGRRRLQKNR